MNQSIRRRGRPPATRTVTATESNWAEISKQIIGQPELDKLLTSVRSQIALVEHGLREDNGTSFPPVGAWLMLGPTGVGKTETVYLIAEMLHGSRNHVLRIDCGEFQMDHEVAKLIGAPPGYLGHRETQPLLNQARVNAAASDRSRFSIILLDEIEKAAPSFQKILLGILDRGTLRLGDNNNVYFGTCLFFFTSNLGAEIYNKPDIGIHRRPEKEIDNAPIRAAKRHFSSEFLNRLTNTVTYGPISIDNSREIVKLHLIKALQPFSRNVISVDFTKDVIDRLMEVGYNKDYGARNLKRAIQAHITGPLALEVSDKRLLAGQSIKVKSIMPLNYTIVKNSTYKFLEETGLAG